MSDNIPEPAKPAEPAKPVEDEEVEATLSSDDFATPAAPTYDPSAYAPPTGAPAPGAAPVYGAAPTPAPAYDPSAYAPPTGAPAPGAASQQPGATASYGQPAPSGYQPPSAAPGYQQLGYDQPASGGYQPPTGYQQPGGSAPAPARNGSAIGALICGICAILFSWVPVVGIVLGVVAIVLAGKAVRAVGKNGQATGGKVCGIVGLIVSILALVGYIALFALGYSAYQNGWMNPTVWEDGSSYGSSQYDGSTSALTADIPEIEEIAKQHYDSVVNQDPALMQELADGLDDSVEKSTGYELAQMGVDPNAVAQWAVTDFQYKLDGTYDNGDGTGTAYAPVQVRDTYAMLTTFSDKVNSEMPTLQTLDQAAQLKRVGELLTQAMNETTDMESLYSSLTMVKGADGTWTLDDDTWEEELDYLFGLY